jgi:hypothetical protein
VNTLKLLELTTPVYFTEDVYIDKKFLLFTRETCFTEDLKRLLSEWQFTLLYTEGSVTESAPEHNEPQDEEANNTSDKVQAQSEQKLSGELIEKTYQKFYDFTDEVYKNYRNSQSLSTEKVIAQMKELCTFVQENRQSVLILQAIMPYNVDNFLVTHSLRSAIFAIVVGMELKMQEHQLVELATAALMHEIGLIHIKEDIYARAEELSDEEKKYLHVHPVLSCKILKKSKFPLPVCLGTLDHHERENGTGYPQKLIGEKISLYGKILAVVCSYELIIGERKYKKAEAPSAGLLNLLRQDPSQYDEEILRALLNALSFFPIGSFVYLSNNAVAQVIDNNSDDPRFPIVRIIGGPAQGTFSEAIRTSMEGIRIMRPARKEEWGSALSKSKKEHN